MRDDMRIKVCMIIATLERGGAEKQLCLLTTNLDRQRFEPVVIALARGGLFEDMLSRRGVRCIVLGKKRAVSPGALFRLLRIIEGEKPDIVHTWMFTSNAYGRVAARLAGIKRTVISERCVDVWKGPLRLAVDKGLSRITDRVVANSRSVARWLWSAGISERLIEVVPNAFDPAGYPLKSLDGIREVGTSPRLVTVGRLLRQKRCDLVLRAMAEIVRAFPDATVTIAGEGPCRAELQALACELGIREHVRMPGTVDHIPGLLLESDLFIMASDFEGMPNAMMEAMYVGVPVVSTAAPGVTDLVRHGVTGVLVPAGDYGALAEEAIALLRDADRRQRIALAAHQEIAEHYSVEAMVKAYERIYESVVQARG